MSRITVVGSLNLDLVVRAPRFAAPGETISGRSFITAAGGKGANQALAARRLGADVAMIGRVGDDGFGLELREGLDSEGVDTRHVAITPATATGVALITVDDSAENTIVVVAGANAALTPHDVSLAEAAIASADVLMVQLEIPLATVTHAMRLARDAGVGVILNAAPAAVFGGAVMSSIDYLIVNRSEALAMTTAPDLDAAAPAVVARALRARGARTVVMTLGSDGALLLGPDDEVLVAPAPSVEAVDTTAAGDAFAGAFAVGVAEGLAPAMALRMGVAAGAIAVTRTGAQPSLPTRREVDGLAMTER